MDTCRRWTRGVGVPPEIALLKFYVTNEKMKRNGNNRYKKLYSSEIFFKQYLLCCCFENQIHNRILAQGTSGIL